jgi:hypothetical protein
MNAALSGQRASVDSLPHRDDPVDWDMILRFLPVFERPGYSPGRWETPPGADIGFYVYSEDVCAFENAAYDARVVYSFDWPTWSVRYGQRLLRDRDALRRARLPTLRKLLITHLRANRFREGHLGEMLNTGHLTELLTCIRHRTLGSRRLPDN